MGAYDRLTNKNIITISQGSTFSDMVTVTDTASGAPIDLTGYAARSQLRTITGALAGDFTCTIPSPATGVIVRSMAAAVTAALSPTLTIGHVWGIELTGPTGSVLPEIAGGAMITPEVVI